MTSEPVVHLPVVHSTLPPNSIQVPLQTVPLQTAVIPAQIQISSQATVPQSVQINQSPANMILQPPPILVPSECIQQAQPNANMPMPPMHPMYPPPPRPMASSANFPTSHPSTHETGLPPVHIPPPNYAPVMSAAVAASGCREESFGDVVPNALAASNYKSSQFINESDGYRTERALISKSYCVY